MNGAINMSQLVSWFIPIIGVLLAAGIGRWYLSRDRASKEMQDFRAKDREHGQADVTAQASVNIAEIASQDKFIERLLTRIDHLEKKLSEFAGKAMNAENRLGKLEYEARDCVEQLTVVQAEYAKVQLTLATIKLQDHLTGKALEFASDAIVITDHDGKIELWNDAAKRLFGYSLFEVRGKDATMLMPERYKAAHLAGLARGKEKGQYTKLGQVLPLHGLKNDGTEFSITTTLGAFERDQELHFIAVIRAVPEHLVNATMAVAIEKGSEIVDLTK